MRHTARCGRELPAEHAHQRGLAGTVGAYYAIAVAGSELEIDVPKKGLFAECIPKLLTVIIMCGKISFLFEKRGRESSESLYLVGRPHEHRNIIVAAAIRHHADRISPKAASTFPSKPVLCHSRSPTTHTITMSRYAHCPEVLEVVDYGGKPGIIVDSKSDTHFRGRHHVDACAVGSRTFQRPFVQKAVGKQHASALYLYGRDAVLGCHGLYGAVGRVLNISVPGASGSRVLSRRTGMLCSLAGNTQAGCRILSAEICQLGGLFKMERAHRRRALYKAGVVIVHTVDIGPNLDLLGVQHSPYYRGGIVAAATTQIVDSPVALRHMYPCVIYTSASPSTSRMRCRRADIWGMSGSPPGKGAHIVESGQHRNPDTLLRGRRSSGLSTQARHERNSFSPASVNGSEKYERMIANERSMAAVAACRDASVGQQLVNDSRILGCKHIDSFLRTGDIAFVEIFGYLHKGVVVPDIADSTTTLRPERRTRTGNVLMRAGLPTEVLGA